MKLKACFLGVVLGLAPLSIFSSVATFAGGCFWCMESDFDKVPGVTKTVVGYTGGFTAYPHYHDASKTGHVEAIEVTFDPDKITYQKLLDIFWHNIDPTDDGGQFCDRGPSYRAAIFYHNKEQATLAFDSKKALEVSGRFKTVVTNIEAAGPFYPAENYHQEYYKKNPIRYHFYRYNCGRDKRLQELWRANDE